MEDQEPIQEAGEVHEEKVEAEGDKPEETGAVVEETSKEEDAVHKPSSSLQVIAGGDDDVIERKEEKPIQEPEHLEGHQASETKDEGSKHEHEEDVVQDESSHNPLLSLPDEAGGSSDSTAQTPKTLDVPAIQSELQPAIALTSTPRADTRVQVEQKPLIVKRKDSFVDASALSELQAYLLQKIPESETSEAEQTIHKAITSRLTEKQICRYLPPMLKEITDQFQSNAAFVNDQGEMALEIQSNLCLLEQIYLDAGRKSPLQNIYTEEETEMLELLSTSSAPPTPRVVQIEK